jgi:hypothetical protein
MDILNFISWIRGRRQVTTVDPSKTLIPVGLKDGRRDDEYLAGAISVQDLADQIVPPPPVNPTSGFYPINKDGVFVDSGLQNALSTPPFGYDYIGLKFVDAFSSSNLLQLNPLAQAMTFGDAYYTSGSGVGAMNGIATYAPVGEAVIGCGISSDANGVFRASGSQGFITIGNTPSSSIGVNMFDQSVRIGSNLINGAPSNTTTPAAWTKVQDQNGTTYYSPLYQ